MLYLFHGTDLKKTRVQMRKFVDKLHSKKPDAIFVEVDDETFSEGKCEEFLASQGLFERYVIVIFSSVLENKEIGEYVRENIKPFSQSDNVFVFLEGEIPKKQLSLFEKHADKIWKFDERESVKKQEFNIFSLTDAIGKRDKKRAWVLLQEANMAGTAPENVHGIIFWQVKNLALVKQREPKGQKALLSLKLNPFVLRKTLSFCKNYTYEELQKFSSELVHIYHQARRGGPELEISLERWVLGI